jgi:serine/threonine-protein kinase
VAERSRQLSEGLLRLGGALRHAAPLAPGDVVEDRYRVVRAIGSGGMGQVHEVERLSDRRRLALKVLTGVVDRIAMARFAREAQIAAQLDHPNVVAVLDLGVSQSGMLFLVMELVTGSTLAAEKARYGDAAWALPILRQIATALAALHARGIVHRDLKPANVLLADRGAQVADFGLASLAEPADPLDPTASTISPANHFPLTRPGTFMGTPAYMAPELIRGAREAQPAADMWSFGVIAHELLAGKSPFAEPPVLAHLAGREGAPAAPLDAPALPARLRELLDGCLRSGPAERPTSSALRDALEAA